MLALRETRNPEEDWTGLKDAKARRKLQNRLNVRAHRRRKAHEAHSAWPQDARRASELPVQSLDHLRDQVMRMPRPSRTLSRIWASPFLREYMERRTFPLSADHLIPLAQFNILRATLTNMTILSLLHTMPLKCHDILGQIPLFPSPTNLPESLAPTDLQMHTPHDTWIDMLPDPTLRDNAIISADILNQEEICIDLVGRMCHGLDAVELTGMLVWNDPWRPEGWEVTDGFARKWGFLLKGCERLLDSTNKWRAQRGEEPLIVEI